VGVVGTGLASDVRQQQDSQLAALGRGQIAALDTVQTQAALLARVTAQPSCRLTAAGQRQCGQLLDESAVWPAYFAAEIGSRGDAVELPTRGYVLTAGQLRALEGEP